MNSFNKDNNFLERPFTLVSGGNYDDNGFYTTPNGSFWDPDGVYFNREGYDKHGGYYDDNLEYHPGEGWIEELMCYEDEKDNVIKQSVGYGGGKRGNRNNEFDDDDDDLDDVDELYEDIDFERLMVDDYKPNSSSSYNTSNTGNTVNTVNTSNTGIINTNNVNNLNNVNKESNTTSNVNATISNVNDKTINKTNSTTTNNNTTTDHIPIPSSIKEEPKITADLLFNKIPDNKVPQQAKKENKPVEKQIEVDSLFK